MFSTETPPAPRRLRRCDAATYVREVHGAPCATATLETLASVGGGPVFVKFGRIPLYATADLDAWVAARTSRPLRSTSDIAA